MARKGLQLEALVVPIVPDIARYQKELNKVKGITVKIGIANEAAIKKYFVNPLNLVGAAARKNFQQMGTAAASAGAKIQQAGSMAASGIRSMSAALRTAQRDTKNLKTQVDALSARLKALERQAKRTGKAVQQSGINRKNRGGMMDAGFGLGMAGAGLTAGVTAPIVGAAGFGIKQMIEAESSFAGVAKTVNTTEMQLESLKRGFRDMALEIPAGINELNKIGESAGQLGIQTGAILEFSEVMAKMGVTTNLSSDEAATALARFANITQMSQQDFGKLGSTIVHLGNQFATTEAEIVNMGLRVAGMGTQAGMSEGEILALSTAASSLGLNVEMGGTAISRLIARMQTTTSAAKGQATAFSDVAGTTGEYFQQLMDTSPAKAIEMFVQGLNRTKKAGGDVIGILKEMGITETRERDTVIRLANGANLLTRALQEQAEGWSGVDALTNEANKRFATTESQLQLLWNHVVEVGIQLGEALAPALNHVVDAAGWLVQKLQGMVEWFTALPAPLQYTIELFLAFAAALGPLAVGISGIIITLGGLAFAAEALSLSMAGVTSAIAALGPAGIVVAATAGILMLMDHYDMLGASAQSAAERMRETQRIAAAGASQVSDARKEQLAAAIQSGGVGNLEAQLKQELATGAQQLTSLESKTATQESQIGWSDTAKSAIGIESFNKGSLKVNQQSVKLAKERQKETQEFLKLVQKEKAMQMLGQASPFLATVKSAEDVQSAEEKKSAVQKKIEQYQKQQKAQEVDAEARAQLGLPPLNVPKPEGIDAVRQQMEEAQQKKGWQEQVAQEMGIAKPPKLTGVAAQEAFLQNKMQTAEDRQVAAQNLGLPPKPGPRVSIRGAATGRRSMGGEAGLGQSILSRQSPMYRPPAGHVSKRNISPYAAMQAAKAKHQISGARKHVSGGFGGIVRGSDARRNFATGEDAIRHARLARQPEVGIPGQQVAGGGSWRSSDFTPKRNAARQQVKPMKQAIEEGTIAAKEKQREVNAYEDTDSGNLKRIADNTAGLKNKTIVVKPANLES